MVMAVAEWDAQKAQADVDHLKRCDVLMNLTEQNCSDLSDIYWNRHMPSCDDNYRYCHVLCLAPLLYFLPIFALVPFSAMLSLLPWADAMASWNDTPSGIR